MPKVKPILIFALVFFPLFGMLIAPWPSAKGIYARYFQSLGNNVLGCNSGQKILNFQPLSDPKLIWPQDFDTGITLANRNFTNADGSPKGFMLTVDSWQMGWVPTAFLLALVLATPIPWRRRFMAALWGLLWIHLFILFTLEVFIWNESTRVWLVILSPFWKAIADQVETLALDPAGPSFFAAAFIWILVAFRRQDFAGWKVSISVAAP